MSKLKDALEAMTSTLQRETPRVQNILEEWERHGIASHERGQFDRLKDKYENGALVKRATSELAFCEENDEEISRLEDQYCGDNLRDVASAYQSYADRLGSIVADLESRASEDEGAELFGKNYVAFEIQTALADGTIPYHGKIKSELKWAHEREGKLARSPKKLLRDMTRESYEDPINTVLFCRLFDFKTTLDGFETHAVVPPNDGDDIPQYIGGEFYDAEYDCSKPENFVWVAFKQLGELCEEYNDARSDDLSEEEEVELKNDIKQKARPIMNRVVDEAHDKYGTYRDSIIASVQKKQDEYDLNDDVISAFANRVTKRINALTKNVENEFSEETQFHGDGNWGVFRIY